MMTPEQVAERIGTPWARDHDCWRAFCEVQAKYWGRTKLPTNAALANDFEYAVWAMGGNHPEVNNWRKVEKPEDGDAVLMSLGTLPFHIGTWVHGGILHCVRSKGEVFNKPHQLSNMSVKILEYRRYDPPDLPE